MENIPRIRKLPLSAVIMGEEIKNEDEISLLKRVLPLIGHHISDAEEIAISNEDLKANQKQLIDNCEEKDRPQLLLMCGRRLGNECYTRGDYEEAITCYKSAFDVLSKSQGGILSPKFYNSTYMKLFRDITADKDWMLLLDLMACCNNIAQCHLKVDNVPSVSRNSDFSYCSDNF